MILELLKGKRSNYHPIWRDERIRCWYRARSRLDKACDLQKHISDTARRQNFTSSEKLHKDSVQVFGAPTKLSLNHWGLSGSWNVNAESAVLQTVPGKIVFRFHSRDMRVLCSCCNER